MALRNRTHPPPRASVIFALTLGTLPKALVLSRLKNWKTIVSVIKQIRLLKAQMTCKTMTGSEFSTIWIFLLRSGSSLIVRFGCKVTVVSSFLASERASWVSQVPQEPLLWQCLCSVGDGSSTTCPSHWWGPVPVPYLLQVLKETHVLSSNRCLL